MFCGGASEVDNKEEENQPDYKLFYWSGLKGNKAFSGKATPICWLLTHVGASFDTFVPKDVKIPGTFGNGAVPKVTSKDGQVAMSQVTAIMQVLGTRHNLAPTDPADAARAIQYSCDAVDFLAQAYMQKDNAKWFDGTMIPENRKKAQVDKWLSDIKDKLAVKNKGFLIADTVTYVDFLMLSSIQFACDRGGYENLKTNFPTVDAYRLKMKTMKGYVEWKKKGIPKAPPS